MMKRLFVIVARNVEDKEFPMHYSLFFEEIKELYDTFVDRNVEKLQADLQNVLEQISGYIIEGGMEDPLQADEE